MGTDTWWRYYPPGFDHSLGQLWSVARGEILAKFSSSWLATLRTFVSAHFLEVALAAGATQLRRAAAAGAEPSAPAVDDDGRGRRGLRAAVLVTLACFAFNFLVLPLYSYRSYSWRHYLGFALPVLWLGAAMTLLHLGQWAAPTWQWLRDQVQRRPGHALAVAVVLVLLLLRTSTDDGNFLAMGISKFWQSRWLMASLVILAILTARSWRRLPGPLLLTVGATLLVAGLYRPHLGHKNFTHIHVPAYSGVWDELRQRRGLVSSFALQTQVSWNTGRKNIPAPEFVMNLYAMSHNHHLELEDVYIESPEAALAPYDGLFGRAAPGFEGYQRLAKYQAPLPGYTLSFHEEGTFALPRYRIGPRPKSSTVYTLTDHAALAALQRTPDSIVIGEEAQAVFAAHGFGGYYAIDGKATLAATDATRWRYTPRSDQPWEDTSFTFFVDERVPTAVTVDFYAPGKNEYTFYWNLDLEGYTAASARPAQLVGEFKVPGPGWYQATFPVSPAQVRQGLNKLGFRAKKQVAVALCDRSVPELLCALTPGEPRPTQSVAVVTDEPNLIANVAMFMHRLDFSFAPGAAPR
jgi:hypothetical protein